MLLPAFKDATGIEVKVIAKGTGAAIRDGMDGNVDIIFVHARAREDKFVAEGYGTKRYAVMHNDFVVIGPKDDPAGVDKTADVLEGLRRIAADKQDDGIIQANILGRKAAGELEPDYGVATNGAAITDW